MNTEKRMFGEVVSDAPMWKGAPEEDLQQIVDCLSSASYHYADDRCKEWRLGTGKVIEAANLCAKHSLDFSALERLHRHAPQLVTLNQFVSAVMRANWEKGYKEALDK